jgi:hypothetical protein
MFGSQQLNENIQDEKEAKWGDKSIVDDMKRFYRWFKKAKKYLLVVVLWAVTNVLIAHKVLFFPSGPASPEFFPGNITELDFFLFFAISLTAGLLLADPKRIFFGYIGSMFLSILMMLSMRLLWDFLYSPLFAEAFSKWGWLTIEWIIFKSISLMFRNLFLVPLLSFLGVFLGGVFRSFLRE